MSLRGKQVSDLKRVVDVLSGFDGVIGIILFGSYARGDYDEYSDYDLLVLFKDRSSMWGSWSEFFRAVGALRMNLHVIPETVEELRGANPVFLEELVKYGKVLYAKFPMEVFLRPINLKPYALIFYGMSGLSIKDKMRVSYLLYRRGKGGLVTEAGGVKLNESCILVPCGAAENVLKILSSFGVKTKKIEVFLDEDAIREISGDLPTKMNNKRGMSDTNF